MAPIVARGLEFVRRALRYKEQPISGGSRLEAAEHGSAKLPNWSGEIDRAEQLYEA